MAGKKDQSVIIIHTELTTEQAARILSDSISSKNKHAPLCRSTAITGPRTDIGTMLSDGRQKLQLGTSTRRGNNNDKAKQLPSSRATGG